jgi:hypothetical protein
MMKQDEKKELLRRIEILKWERDELRKNYVNAQKEVATAIYHTCVELCKGQGDVVYDVDFWDIFSPWGVEVAEGHKLNREEYDDEVE